MVNETVIDLGLDRWPPEDQEPPVDLRRVWARRRRPLVSAVCAALLLVTLAAAAPPPSPGLTLVARLGEANGFFVSGDHLVISTATGVSSVYPLSTGDRLWSGPNLYPGNSPDVLYSEQCPNDGFCDEPDTVVWDIATGARLGTLPRGAVPGTGLRMVASGYHEVPVRGSLWWFGSINRPDRIEARDATGAARWSVDHPDWLDYLIHTGDDAPVVIVYSDSTVAVHDAVTGVVSSRYRLPESDESILSVAVDRGLLLVTNAVGDDTVVRALDWDTLLPRWQRRWDGNGWISGCGPLLCYSDDTSYMTVLDPATGAKLWSTREWLDVAGDRFLIRRQEEFSPVGWRPGGGHRVVAPRTGETLVDLGRWRVVGTGVDGAVVLTAPTSAGTAVALLDPGALTPRYLGSVATKFQHCSLFAEGMVCDGDAGITLWALDRPTGEP